MASNNYQVSEIHPFYTNTQTASNPSEVPNLNDLVIGLGWQNSVLIDRMVPMGIWDRLSSWIPIRWARSPIRVRRGNSTHNQQCRGCKGCSRCRDNKCSIIHTSQEYNRISINKGILLWIRIRMMCIGNRIKMIAISRIFQMYNMPNFEISNLVLDDDFP